jgi:hypothetical protein
VLGVFMLALNFHPSFFAIATCCCLLLTAASAGIIIIDEIGMVNSIIFVYSDEDKN